MSFARSDHPKAEKLISEIKELSIIEKMRSATLPDAVSTSPLKAKAAPAPAPAAPELSAAEKSENENDEFPEPDEEEEQAICRSARQRAAPSRYTDAFEKPAEKTSKGKDGKSKVETGTCGRGQKRGHRGRDENGNPVKLEYNKKGKADDNPGNESF